MNKKIIAGAGITLAALAGAVGFSGGDFSPDEVVAIEQQAQEIFGGDAKAVEQMIFNEMRPAQVKVKGRDWELDGMNFKSHLKESAEDGWEYEENGKSIGFTSTGMAWDGEKVKTKAEKVAGQIKELEVAYEDALGDGVDIKIVQDNYKFQKIITIDSLASLGEIPEGAEYLEFSFKLSGDFDLPEGRIDDRIPFGENSFVNPIRAWDSSESLENPEDEIQSGAFGEIKDGVLTKKIPVAWLKQATFPVMTDATITYGSENVFNSTTTVYADVSALDSTHFAVIYRDNTTHGTAIVGAVSGTTISSYGTESVFNATVTSHISVAALDSTHFVATYRDEGGSDYGCARVALVSGTTISSFGTENCFNSAGTYFTSVAALDSAHFVATYRDVGASNYGVARVGSVSGTVITYGAENTFNSGALYYNNVAALDSTHFVAAYRDDGNSSHGTAIVGAVSGTTISSYGSENVFNAAVTNYVDVSVLDSTHFVVAYTDVGNSRNGTAIVGAVSGTTISSYGSENVYNSAVTIYNTVAALDSTNFAVAYKDDGGSDYGGAKTGTVSGTTVSSYGAENLFNPADTDYISVSALDSTNFAIGYTDVGSSSYGTGIVGSILSEAVDDALFFGTSF